MPYGNNFSRISKISMEIHMCLKKIIIGYCMFDVDAEYNYENASYIILFLIIFLMIFRRNLQKPTYRLLF